MKLRTGVWLKMLIYMSASICANHIVAKTHVILSESNFDKWLAATPISVVVFYDKDAGHRNLRAIIEKVSRMKRYKEAKLKFFLVDRNRHDLCNLFARYEIEQNYPRVQIFLRTKPMRNAFMTGLFKEQQLVDFIEKYLSKALTIEINRKRVRKELAQAPRAYYAADYYNPFYMMPWDNYSPPSDWPDQGPQWVGIDVD